FIGAGKRCEGSDAARAEGKAAGARAAALQASATQGRISWVLAIPWAEEQTVIGLEYRQLDETSEPAARLVVVFLSHNRPVRQLGLEVKGARTFPGEKRT